MVLVIVYSVEILNLYLGIAMIVKTKGERGVRPTLVGVAPAIRLVINCFHFMNGINLPDFTALLLLLNELDIGNNLNLIAHYNIARLGHRIPI